MLSLRLLTGDCNFPTNMSNKIEHQGVVECVEGDCLKVKIQQTSACLSCKVSKHCNASEQKIKIIDVYDAVAARTMKVGDEVTVWTSVAAGYRAVTYGFIIPLVLMVVALISAIVLKGGEAVAALVSIAVLAIYYFVLYLFRGKLQRKFTFQIDKH